MRRRNKQLKGIRPVGILKLITIPLVCAGVYLGVRFLLGKIELNKVDCVSQYGQCTHFLTQKFNSFIGEKYLSGIRLIKILANEDPMISSFNLQYVPLAGVRINLIEKEAKYSITTSNKESYSMIDNEGVVLSFSEATQLPTLVTADQPTEKGMAVSRHELFALKLMALMHRNYQVNLGRLEGDGLVVELPHGPDVIFPLSGDREVLMGSLILVYNDLNSSDGSKLNTNGKIIDTIDLRFKNPVLR